MNVVRWVVGLFKGLLKAIALKLIDGLALFGRATLVVKLIAIAVIFAWIVAGVSYFEWRGQQAEEIEAGAPPVEKAVVPAKVSPGLNNKVHTVQVAAVTSPQQAKRLISSLKNKGVKGLYTVEAKRKSGGKWYKIRIGQFPTEEKAQEYANQLMEAKAIKNYFVKSFFRPTGGGGDKHKRVFLISPLPQGERNYLSCPMDLCKGLFKNVGRIILFKKL